MKVTYNTSKVIYNIPSENADKYTQKDVLRDLDAISKEYGNGVMIELSDEAKELLQISAVNGKGQWMTEEYKNELEKRRASIQPYLEPAQKLHLIIPNIKTNDKLEKSLADADESVKDAAYNIIRNNFLPHDIGNMTEDERLELISVGLEESRYLSQFLDDSKAAQFMDAMETIAKYGTNGKVDENGKVTYDIRQGGPVGAPDDYMMTSDLMQRLDPEAYKTFSEMFEAAVRKNDNELLYKATKWAMNWEINAYRENYDAIEEIKKEQKDWQSNTENTQLKNNFVSINNTDIKSFVDNLLAQNKILNQEFLLNTLKAFTEMLQNKK